MAPPLEQHRVADELEPRGELEVGLLEHLLQLIGGDVAGVADLVGVDLEVDVGLDEKDVVDCMTLVMHSTSFGNWNEIKHTFVLSPLAITRRLVVYPGQELELVERHLLRLDAQLVVQLALRGPLDAHDRGIELRTRLPGHAQRVRAAGVGPHVSEGDLLGGALLEQQTLVGVEEEDGEGTVQEAFVDVGHEVTCTSRITVSILASDIDRSLASRETTWDRLTGLLASAANRLVILIQDDAHLVHQTNLLLIVALQLAAVARRRLGAGGENIAGQGGVDVGEKRGDVFRRDLLSSSRGAHIGICFSAEILQIGRDTMRKTEGLNRNDGDQHRQRGSSTEFSAERPARRVSGR